MNEKEGMRQMLSEGGPGMELLRELAASGRLQGYKETDRNQAMIVVASERGFDDSVEAECGCKKKVRLSPSTVEMMKHHKAQITVVCIECASKMVKARGSLMA